jgi:hypothetical protein
MMKSICRIAASLLLVAIGFTLALYSQWTSSVNYQRTTQNMELRILPDGSIAQFPQHIETVSLMVNTAPYYEAPAVDLFGSDK